MTKLVKGRPVIRELPLRENGAEWIEESHPTVLRYRLKGTRGPVFEIDKAVIIAIAKARAPRQPIRRTVSSRS